ncbi:MAG: hypothetical protein ACM3S2_11490 [Ignavibacteriales bacterium]
MKKTKLLLISLLSIFSAVQAQEKTSPKFSGVAFGDYFYNIEQRDSTKNDLNGFQFRRVYFTADFVISEKFDSRFRLEADQGPASLTSGGRIGVMVKDAYLRWKNLFNGSDLIFGLSPTPAFDVTEAAWGYRAIEKTTMDFFGLVATRDLGIDLKGNLNGQGSIRYWLKIGNNSINGPELNKYKRFYGLLHFIPLNNFQFTLYGDYASAPKKLDASDKTFKTNAAFTGSVMLNYFEKDRYSVGLESFFKSQQNNFSPRPASTLEAQNGYGISVFGWAAVNDLLRIVARFDTFEPNKDKDNDQSSLLIGALDFRVDKNVSIMPNIEMVKYQGISPKDLVGRVTFYFQF